MTDTDRDAQARFGANVESLRQRAGMSVEALAERSELDQHELVKILRGEADASTNAVYVLAGALGVDPGDLFEGMSWAPPADGGNGFAISDSTVR